MLSMQAATADHVVAVTRTIVDIEEDKQVLPPTTVVLSARTTGTGIS